ncbi:copper resistance protein NlpE [Sphingobacterium griseoflavum]|nr:copper resistance protein NlpE [Sphingobacterium griseoflavum]
MKKLFGLLVVGAFLISCVDLSSSGESEAVDTSSVESGPSTTGDNSQTSIDWVGTYEGTIPCADCPGIKTTIVINNDETFRIRSEYLDRGETIEDNGKIMWHENGSVVHLKGKDTDLKLKVGENQLFHLDKDGKVIEGDLASNYIYKKKA